MNIDEEKSVPVELAVEIVPKIEISEEIFKTEVEDLLEEGEIINDVADFVEEIKQAAQSVSVQSGFVYEPTSGLYYDCSTGYYYNAVKQIFFVALCEFHLFVN